MTVLGWILFVLFIIASLALLGNGLKSGLNIDKWSDLRKDRDKEKDKAGQSSSDSGRTFNIHIPDILP